MRGVTVAIQVAAVSMVEVKQAAVAVAAEVAPTVVVARVVAMRVGVAGFEAPRRALQEARLANAGRRRRRVLPPRRTPLPLFTASTPLRHRRQ